MGLSLDAIHAPLNDFFLNHFKTDSGSPVMFRFDKFGSVISDQDFMDPNHPELGYVQGLAMERFSDLVNHVTDDSDDGLNVVLSQDTIDEAYYFRLFSPAVAAVPNDADESTAASILNSFGAIKLSAQKKWDDVKAQSSTGLLMQYKPSLAEPADWYDATKKDSWTDQTFSISDPAPPAPSAPPNNLWRLKLNAAAMQSVLQANVSRISPTVYASMVAVKPQPVLTARPILTARIAQPVSRMAAVRAMSSVSLASPVATAAQPSVNTFALHDNFRTQFKALALDQRLAVNRSVATSAPTEPAQTNSVSISFSYCLVKINRPWLMDAFLNDKSWCVPALKKGDLTKEVGGALQLMPIGFVAIRDLNISANWSANDLSTAANATDFGPFKIDSTIVNNKLSHPGIQIIGWLVQKMPDLPPNDPPIA